jgi:hypothetical protein
MSTSNTSILNTSTSTSNIPSSNISSPSNISLSSDGMYRRTINVVEIPPLDNPLFVYNYRELG